MPEGNTQQAVVENQGGGTTVRESPVRKPAPPQRVPRELPPFKVLLHNDDVNTFEHVVQSIVQLTTLSTKEALLRALEAHEAGLALLLVTHQERAELYVAQFMSLSLSVTIEPA